MAMAMVADRTSAYRAPREQSLGNMSFEDARVYMTCALSEPTKARAIVAQVRSDPNIFARFDYREQTILKGIYGDVHSWNAR